MDVGVGVLVGIPVAVGVCVGVLVGVRVAVGVLVDVGVCVGVLVGVLVDVGVVPAPARMMKLSAKLPPSERRYCALSSVSVTVYFVTPQVVLSDFAK